MKNKMLSVFLTIVMLMSAIPFVTSAAETVPTDCVIQVKSVEASPGETVQIDIDVIDNPGIMGAILSVSYDADLILVDAENGEAFQALQMTKPVKYKNGCNFVWYTQSLAAGQIKDGTILRLFFTVSEDAKEDEMLSVSVSYEEGNVSNTYKQLINPQTKSGGVYTISFLPGDVNGDKKISILDLIDLCQYIADGCETDPEGYNITVNPSASDVTGDGKITILDLINLCQYIADGCETDPEGYNITLVTYHKEHTHTMQATAAKAATCTENGNIAYWYCTACEKYFADEAGKTEISIEDTVIKATGHTYAAAWSYDDTYHWHAATCGHTDEVSDKATHTYNSDHACSTCGAADPKSWKLSAPIIQDIRYDTVYWNEVPNADTYTIRVNDNYELTLRGTSCKLSDVKWNGNPITSYGYVSIKVMANQNGEYYPSEWSQTNNSYYYVPSSNSNEKNDLIKYSIGFGYNLIEDDYLDVTKCSNISVFDVGKLLTIGNYTKRPHSGGTGFSYNYESIDEFISKTKLSVEYGQNVGCVLLGSVKMQITADLGFDYRSYEHNNTFIYEYNWTYKDHIITNFSNDNLLKYCLSDNFLQDVRKESMNTAGMNDDQLVEYLFDTYGTHAILGITTGGKYVAEYVISTNDTDIAASVKVAFDLSTGGGGAIDQIIQKDFNIGIDLGEDLSWKNSSTEAHFTTWIYGGSGGGATSATGVDSAIKDWTKSLSEDNARSVMLTENGAISIISLLSMMGNSSIASKFEQYVDTMADKTYHELFDKYTKPTSLPMSVETNNGNNILTIDISSYQQSGSLQNAYNPNLLNGELTVYPTMMGKSIDGIHVIGAFRENMPLINGFTIVLAKSWNRPVTIEFENCGIKCETLKDPLDLSALRSGVDVTVTYEGYNCIEDSSGITYIRSSSGETGYVFSIRPDENEALIISSCCIKGEQIYLPVAEKPGYEFGGWLDIDDIPVTDDMGLLDETYNFKYPATVLQAKWNNHVTKIQLDNQNANTDSQGTDEYYDQYLAGMYPDSKCCENKLEKIAVPQRYGYMFSGYYREKEGTGDRIIDENGNIEKSINNDNVSITYITLYAYWTPAVYKITVEANGGSEVASFYVKYSSGVYADEGCTDTLSEINIPTNGINIFGGCKDATGKTVIDASGKINTDLIKKYTSDQTITVQWTDVYTITLNSTGAVTSGTTEFYTKDFKSFYADKDLKTPLQSIVKPSKTGYTFSGYYDSTSYGNNLINSEGKIDWGDKERGNITLYAQWKPINYKITLNANSNAIKTVTTLSKSSASVEFNSNTNVIGKNIVSAKYYVLNGWYTSSTGGTKVADANGNFLANVSGYTDAKCQWVKAAGATLYAHWEQESEYSDYTYISTTVELKKIASTGKYLLVNDINLNGESWNPIDSFYGTIDGGGKSIYNFTINKTSTSDSELQIGFVKSNNGIIKNLTLGKAGYTTKETVDLKGSSSKNTYQVNLGGIACLNYGTINNCHLVNVEMSASVKNEKDRINYTDAILRVGGISSHNIAGTIVDCTVDGSSIDCSLLTDVDSGVDNNGVLGGICGINSGEIINCEIKGNSTLKLDVNGDGTSGNHAYPVGRLGCIAGAQEKDSLTTDAVINISGCKVNPGNYSLVISYGGNTNGKQLCALYCAYYDENAGTIDVNTCSFDNAFISITWRNGSKLSSEQTEATYCLASKGYASRGG